MPGEIPSQNIQENKYHFILALLSAILDLSSLVEMLSIGTLLAYAIVVICVLILRYRPGESNYKEIKSVKIIHESFDADAVEAADKKEIKGEKNLFVSASILGKRNSHIKLFR